ncbi:MAG: NAD(+)/NADH kinase [Candidatus Bathyarchaeia archaeon]
MAISCGLVAKRTNEAALDLALEIRRFLISRGVTVFPEEDIASARGLGEGRPLEQLYADFIVTVGGDGTVLKTCLKVPKPDTPILAVNMGRRGYLAGNYRLDRHSRISASFGGKHLGDGLNEVLITSPSPYKMIHIRLTLDEGESTELSADGLIISTPTGSTAHAFSAGGPILHPFISAFNIVFICPLEPIRSIIVPDNRRIKVGVGENTPALVTIDGALNETIPPGSEIQLRKADHDAVFVRFGESFFSKSLSRLISRGVKA